MRGNVIDWHTAIWTLENLVPTEVEDFCDDSAMNYLYFYPIRSQKVANLLCQRIQGELMVTKDDQSIQKAWEVLKKTNDKDGCGNFFIAKL